MPTIRHEDGSATIDLTKLQPDSEHQFAVKDLNVPQDRFGFVPASNYYIAWSRVWNEAERARLEKYNEGVEHAQVHEDGSITYYFANRLEG